MPLLDSGPVRRLASLSLTIAICHAPATAQARTAETHYFAYADERLLRWPQHDGGAVFVPGGAVDEEPLALVVLLHGTNPNAYLHLWLGGGGRDLRPFAASLVHTEQVLPFVLAAPSQTRSAGSGAALWNAFQLRTFVEAIEDALVGAVQIDRQRIVVFGHSAAGCNPEGGLASDFWTAEGVSAWALVSVDPCLDAQMGTAMARRPSTVPLWVWWQSRSWQRSPVDFWAALTLMTGDARTDRMQKLAAPEPNPHETIVPLAFERTLRELLRSPPDHD